MILIDPVFPNNKLTSERFASYAPVDKRLGRIILHAHLEGSVPAKSLRMIAKRNGIPLPFDLNPAKLSRCVQEHGWSSFIRLYHTIAACFRRGEDFRDSLCEYATALSEQGVAYAEVYCTPWLHQKRGVSLDHIAYGLQEAITWARGHLTIDMRILIDLTRNHEEPAYRIVDWFLDLPKDIFVGLGFTGGPKSQPLNTYKHIAQKVRSDDRGIVVHAGELEGPDSVREAIYTLQASRIGHGLRVLEDPYLTEELAKTDVHFELCPSSNRHLLRNLDLPCLIQSIHEKGFNISINPDDELIFNTSILGEIQWVLNHTNLEMADLYQMQINSAEKIFADQATKSALLRTFIQGVDLNELWVAP